VPGVATPPLCDGHRYIFCGPYSTEGQKIHNCPRHHLSDLPALLTCGPWTSQAGITENLHAGFMCFAAALLSGRGNCEHVSSGLVELCQNPLSDHAHCLSIIWAINLDPNLFKYKCIKKGSA